MYSSLLKEFLPELIELRRHIHSHPELSGQEHQTAALIAGEMRKYGCRVREGIGKTGIVAEVGPEEPPLVALRVDMDALPIEEKTNLEYASLTQGVMHACGHDIHTCIGLGVARLLAENSNLTKSVRFIFQPAEEIAQGARWMKDDGAIDGLQALFGVHVAPELSVGQIGVRAGSLTAAAAELEIDVLGEGGHGARPHESIDAIWIASRIVTGLQESISRELNALHPVVISFGKIEGGKAFNVIADQVKLLGTVRCLDTKLNKKLPTWIDKKVQTIANSCGGKAVVNFRCIAPPVENDQKLTNLLAKSAESVLGEDQIIYLEHPSLGAEDFAEFLDDVPGTMFRLGVARKGKCAPLHSGFFAPDEKCLEEGIKVIHATLLNWMGVPLDQKEF